MQICMNGLRFCVTLRHSECRALQLSVIERQEGIALHATPSKRDARYDRVRDRVTVPVTVHGDDGMSVETEMVLEPGQLEPHYAQLGRLIERRDRCERTEGWA